MKYYMHSPFSPKSRVVLFDEENVHQYLLLF